MLQVVFVLLSGVGTDGMIDAILLNKSQQQQKSSKTPKDTRLQLGEEGQAAVDAERFRTIAHTALAESMRASPYTYSIQTMTVCVSRF